MPTTLTATRPLDVREVAEVLAAYTGHVVSKQTLTTWIHEGHFPHARKTQPNKANSKWRIPLADLVAYVIRFYPGGPLYAVPEIREPLLTAVTDAVNQATAAN